VTGAKGGRLNGGKRQHRGPGQGSGIGGAGMKWALWEGTRKKRVVAGHFSRKKIPAINPLDSRRTKKGKT